jgi:hypothetical protein
MLKSFDVSPTLNGAIQHFIVRLDMNEVDKKMFHNILGFTFNEGFIQGTESILTPEEIPGEKKQ